MSRRDTVVGVDIGGTKLVAALISSGTTVVNRVSAPTPAAAGAAAVLDKVSALVDRVTTGHEFAAVGVGSAGVVDPKSGVIVGATDAIRGWVGTNLCRELGARLDVPMRAVNDVAAFAHAENRHGAARDAHTLIAVMVGTGIGGALIVNGTPLHGRHAAAGHLGHVPTPQAAGRTCPCGRDGHVEAVASGPAMAAEFARRAGEDVRELQEVARRAQAGEAVAQQVLAEGASALGTALGGLVNTMDPDAIVFGGGVLGIGEPFKQPLRAALSATLIPAVKAPCLLDSQLGDDAVVIGAAAIAWEAVS